MIELDENAMVNNVTGQQDLERFERIKVRGPINLCIQQAPFHRLSIRAGESDRRQVRTKVKDGCLAIEFIRDSILPLHLWREPIRCDLHVENLSHVTTRGMTRLRMDDFDIDTLHLNLQGGGHFNVGKLTANLIDVRISGAGRVEVSGDVEKQRLIINGSGDYLAGGLVSDYCFIRISGSGNASVAVKEVLNTAIFGSGIIKYRGYPDIKKKVVGNGKLVRQN